MFCLSVGQYASNAPHKIIFAAITVIYTITTTAAFAAIIIIIIIIIIITDTNYQNASPSPINSLYDGIQRVLRNEGFKKAVYTFDLASINLIPLTDTDSVTEGIFCSLAVDSYKESSK